ncbi:hypothetical protein, partial [Actinotalea sp.]|uniref:hypothetical protein n=1 Tax=Actinotalea sp. TaxID=1872145 RepID=UPI00356828D1
LIAGVRAPLTVTVANTGASDASAVTTDLVFPADTDWDVQLASTPSGGAGAAVPRAATVSGWSCTEVGATTARCTLPTLAAGTSSDLQLSVFVDDPTLDGDRDLEVRVTTAFAGSTAPVTRSLPTRLSSAPGILVVEDAPRVDLTAAVDRAVSTFVWVPVHNAGRTTLRDAHVQVALPAGLPTSVEVAASSLSTAWTCTADGRLLDCTTATIRPGVELPLLLDVSVPALDLGAAAPFVDVDVDAALLLSAGATTAQAPVTVRSAPGSAVVDLTTPTTVQPGATRPVTIGVGNDGGTSLRDLSATITLPPGLSAADLALPTDWACAATTSTVITCALDEPLVPGTSRPIVVGVTASSSVNGSIAVSIAGAGGALATGTSEVEVLTPALAFEPGVTAEFVRNAGTVSFGVTNTGKGAAQGLTARVSVPRAVTLEEPSAAEKDRWQCTRDDAQHVTCTLASLAPGASATVVLSATAEAATSQSVVVEVTDGQATIASTAKLSISSAGLSPRGRWTGGYAVTEIGTPVLGCDLTSDACRRVMDSLGGSTANNSQSMVPLADPTATLTVPEGREIAFAGLYWSGNRRLPGTGATGDEWTGALTAVSVRGPGADPVPVTGAVLATAVDSGNREYYQSFADVTDLVRAYGAGAWAVDGVAYAATMTDTVPSYYAGWSLVVVYATPGVDQDVSLYDGGAWVATGSSTTFAFEGRADRTARVGVVAWEGDRNGSGGRDALSLGTTTLTPLRADGSSGITTDAFSSTATGSGFNNSLGVDATSFAPVPLADGINRLTASTGGDQYLIGAVTVTSTAQPAP